MSDWWRDEQIVAALGLAAAIIIACGIVGGPLVASLLTAELFATILIGLVVGKRNP